jgi:gluconate:H+ symporter, GntP family
LSHDAWLLLDTALAVAALVLLVAWLKFNSFVALTVVSLAAGLAAGMEPTKVALAFADGVGGVLGKIAIIIGLGAILGQLLAESGGAEQIAAALIRGFGNRRMALAFVAAGFLIGLPVFFQVGLVLLIPIAETAAEKLRIPLSRLGLPLVAGLSASHALIPPHPGALAAAVTLHADIGKTILFGLLVGAPTAVLAWLAFGRVDCSASTGEEPRLVPARIAPPKGPPDIVTALLITLLPVGLMILGAAAEILLPARPESAHWLVLTESPQVGALRRWTLFAGDPIVAMTIAVLLALYFLGSARGFSRRQILQFCETSLLDVGGVLLVVGAGGGFSRVLIDSGVAKAVEATVSDLAMSPLVLGWLMAAVVRVATGSSTVSIITAAGLAAPLVSSHRGVRPELLVVAMGAGSLVLSHVNDGGFWLVQRYVRLTVPQTLRTWTLMTTLISLSALGLILLLAAVC